MMSGQEEDPKLSVGREAWWTASIVNYATFGGVVLGFYSLAMAVRDDGSRLYALFGLSVALAGCLALLDRLACFLRIAKQKRYILMGLGTCAILVLITPILLSLFAFRPA